MRRLFTVLFLALLFVGNVPAASAQTLPPAPASARNDTVTAVHRLFKKRRIGGYIWSGIGAGLAANILVASASDNFSSAEGTLVSVGVLGGVPAGIGINKLSRFSRTREAAVLADFERWHKLPSYVEKRLHFRK